MPRNGKWVGNAGNAGKWGELKPETETETETDAENQTQTQSDLKGSPKKRIQYACEARLSHSGEMNEIFVVYLSGITQRS